jgi:hypothetical protein
MSRNRGEGTLEQCMQHQVPPVRADAEVLLSHDAPEAPGRHQTHQSPGNTAPHKRWRWLHVLHVIQWPAVSIGLIYAITLSIFPGFLSEDVQWPRLGSWYSVLLFSVFTVADCTSRWLPVRDSSCFVLSIARCAAACGWPWLLVPHPCLVLKSLGFLIRSSIKGQCSFS